MERRKGRAALTRGDWETSDPGSLTRDGMFEPTTPPAVPVAGAQGAEERRTADGARLRALTDELRGWEAALQNERHQQDGSLTRAAALEKAELRVQEYRDRINAERLRLGR